MLHHLLTTPAWWQGNKRHHPIRSDFRPKTKMVAPRRGRRRGGNKKCTTRGDKKVKDNGKGDGSKEENAPTTESIAEGLVTEDDVRRGRNSDDGSPRGTTTSGVLQEPDLTWPEGGNGDLDRDIEDELGGEEDNGELFTTWTIKREDTLIDMFQQCQFLYDKNHPEYKLKFKKEMTYKAFGKKLNMDSKYTLH